MKRIFFGFLIVLVLNSCVTSSVVFDIQRPADINVPNELNNIVIANRSRPSKENLAGNIMEGIISGEGIGYDRRGAEYCVEGLSDMLSSSERYTLKNIAGMELKGTGTSSFPPPLDWNNVVNICDSYDADALLVLETFDSDSRTIVGSPIAQTRKRKGVKIKELRYPATLIMEIQSGWRIYDAKHRAIIDENRFTEKKDFLVYGSSPDDAMRRLPSKGSAIKESGFFAGKQYGYRISPMWIKARRTYFTGRHTDLKLARSYVKIGDWDAAIAIWKELSKESDNKIARRSAYNMAIASEIKGGLDAAIDWANKSQKLGEKKAHKYINVLHIRKMNEEKLKQQLNN